MAVDTTQVDIASPSFCKKVPQSLAVRLAATGLGPVSRRDRHLQHAVPLMAEQFISLLDLTELEPMGDQRP